MLRKLQDQFLCHSLL
ncbi:TPA: RepA leader peptide Tap, partial [Klebsiella pneumoniae]